MNLCISSDKVWESCGHSVYFYTNTDTQTQIHRYVWDIFTCLCVCVCVCVLNSIIITANVLQQTCLWPNWMSF